MSQRMVSMGITSPGGLGLNRQVSGGILPTGWATVIENIIYDDKGRLSARNGYQNVNVTTTTVDFKTIHEYIDAAGNIIIIGSSNNKVYRVDGSALTDISGSITTPTADNWKFQNFNGKCVGYQVGHAPIELATVSGTFVNGGGTQYNGTDGLAAYGRTWTIVDNTLYYSDLLINSFAGGSAGSFDLATYWKGGMDEAVAIADFNGYLAVFGKRNIIIYDNPDDPTSAMAIVENISGVGCIARDSIQNTGNDIIFLSTDGVRTLSRVIQEKSLPLGDLSKNNKDHLVHFTNQEVADDIKSVHCKCGNFYLLSLPTAGKSFYLDLRQRLQDGAARMTEWLIAPTALMSTTGATLYFGTGSGFISKYTGYLDGVLSDGTSGTSYDVDWEGAWNDAGEEVSDRLKFPKSIAYTILGGNSQTVTIKWAFDYEDTFKTYNITIPDASNAEWGVAEWGIDEWSGGSQFNKVKAQGAGAGQVFKMGFSATVEGAPLSIQRINIKLKIGRIE